MGKIVLRFFYQGKNVNEEPYDNAAIDVQNRLWGKYNFDKIQELEVDGGDFLIDFEIENVVQGIDWEAVNYPNDTIKGKIADIIYFKPIYDALAKIKDSIDHCSFAMRYDLDGLGEKAILEATKMEDGVYFKFSFEKERFLGDIRHTLNKEVKSLLDIDHNISKKRKEEALYDAKKHLSDDIKFFIISFELMNINEQP
jgi:hypothetical protein